MSILSSLFHHENHDNPNEVHNIAERDTIEFDKISILTAQAKQRKAAMQQHTVHPDLYYSHQEEILNRNGEIWETPHTVASKLEEKEEYPRG
ncbi:MAG: hypothetical protein RR867_08045 [Ruthenibacterium sp.]